MQWSLCRAAAHTPRQPWALSKLVAAAPRHVARRDLCSVATCSDHKAEDMEARQTKWTGALFDVWNARPVDPRIKDIFTAMVERGIPPSEFATFMALDYATKRAEFDEVWGLNVWASYVERSNGAPDVVVTGKTLGLLSKTGRWKELWNVFDALVNEGKQPSVEACNAMLLAVRRQPSVDLSPQDRLDLAVRIFNQMAKTPYVEPTVATFETFIDIVGVCADHKMVTTSGRTNLDGVRICDLPIMALRESHHLEMPYNIHLVLKTMIALNKTSNVARGSRMVKQLYMHLRATNRLTDILTCIEEKPKGRVPHGVRPEEQFYSSLIIAAKITQDLELTKILYEDMCEIYATRRLALPVPTWSSLMHLISKGEKWSIDYMMGAYRFMRKMDVKPPISVFDDLLCRCNSELRDSGGVAAMALFKDMESFGLIPTKAIVKYTFEALTKHRSMLSNNCPTERERKSKEIEEMLTLALRLFCDQITIAGDISYQSYCADRIMSASTHNISLGAHALNIFKKYRIMLRPDSMAMFLCQCIEAKDRELVLNVCESLKAMNVSLPEFKLDRISRAMDAAKLDVDLRTYIAIDPMKARGHYYRPQGQHFGQHGQSGQRMQAQMTG